MTKNEYSKPIRTSFDTRSKKEAMVYEVMMSMYRGMASRIINHIVMDFFEGCSSKEDMKNQIYNMTGLMILNEKEESHERPRDNLPKQPMQLSMISKDFTERAASSSMASMC